jgi:hypothetical protein
MKVFVMNEIGRVGFAQKPVPIPGPNGAVVVKSVLAKAKKGASWTDPHGIHHTEILVDDEIVGNLWEKRDDLHKLEIGGYWTASFGIRAELVHGGKVVGMLWLDE